MLPKYTVEFAVPFHKNVPPGHYSTDDPVSCQQFVEELLERGLAICGIKHEGLDLPKVDFDRIVKTGAGMLASKRICTSLGIKSDEERFRFGFAA